MTAVWQHEETLGATLARRWLRAYTAGLPEELRERRKQELESDLYEHQADRRAEGASADRVGLEVMGRVVRGMPADLLWRMQLEAPPMELKISTGRMTGILLLALVVLIPVSMAISGYDTAREGWESELSRLGGRSSGNIFFQVLVGVSLVAAGAGMFLVLRPRAQVLGTLAAFGFAAGGVLTLGSSAMYGVVVSLADEHVAGRGSAEITTASWAFARAMDALVKSSGVLQVLSVYAVAYALIRHGLAPRWMGWLGLASVVPFALGEVSGPFTGDEVPWVLAGVGSMLIWVSILLAGGSMVLRRSETSATNGGASAAATS